MTTNSTSDPDRADEGAPPDPQIGWGPNGAPRSGRYDDVYYNPEDGRAESEHVFLHGAGFPACWREPGPRSFAELGFGLGLNFLVTLAAWRREAETGSAPPPFRYTAFEIAPPTRDEIRRAMAPWPDLAPLAEALCAIWPLGDGVWRPLGADGPSLRLFLGDARQRAPALAAQEPESIDSWYLDGFSPAKNPEIWDPALMQAVFRLAAPGCRAATFTAAGWVRRGLQEAGFAVHKAGGYGRKRERLLAERPVSD